MKSRKHKRKLDLSFARFFNTEKSPHTHYNPITRIYEYYAKHVNLSNSRLRLIWDSYNNGTYIKSRDGEINIKPQSK